MQLTIFLNMEDAKCLARDAPDTSGVGQIIFRALRLRQGAGSQSDQVFVLCNENEARELLRRAQDECQECIDKILRAFDVAGIVP